MSVQMECFASEVREKAHKTSIEIQNVLGADFAATLQAQINSAVNIFLNADKEKVEAVLNSALTQASSPLVRKLTEQTLFSNIAGQSNVMRAVVKAAATRGNRLTAIRKAIVTALAGSEDESKAAVKTLVQYATGSASLEEQKNVLVKIQAEAAVASGQDVLALARYLQQISGTSKTAVEKSIASLISASTGAAAKKSDAVAAAAYSSESRQALGRLVSSANSQGTKKILLALAKSNKLIQKDIQKSLSSLSRFTKIAKNTASKQTSTAVWEELAGLKEYDGGSVSNARKNVRGNSGNARKAAQQAANYARHKGAAAAGRV